MLALFLGSLLHPYLGEQPDNFLLFCGAPLGLVMTVGWSYLFVVSFHQVEIFTEYLVISRLGRRVVLKLDAVTAVTQNERLTISTAEQDIRLHLIFRNRQARLYAALRRHVPAARDAHQAQQTAPLPLIIRPRRMVQIVISIYFVLGLGMAAVGIGGFWYVATDFDMLNWFERIFIPFLGLACLVIAAWMIHQFLWGFVWRYTFGEMRVELRYGLRRRTFTAANIMDMEIVAEPRTYRGITRILYTLDLWLADGEVVKISPNGAGMPSDYAEEEEKQILTDLMVLLSHHYELNV